MELLMQVEGRYQMAPVKLAYVDEANEQITIDSDLVLRKAIRASYFQSLDKSKVALRLIVSLPTNIEKTDLDPELFKGSQTSMSGDFLGTRAESWTNLSQKESLLYSLNKDTGFSVPELERIYNAFAKVTQKRLVQRNEGYVTLAEFTEIMRYVADNSYVVSPLRTST